VDRPALVVKDPTLIRKFTEDANFFIRPLLWPFQEIFHDIGIVTGNDQEYHRIHRTLALKGLLKTNVLRNTATVINDKVAAFVAEVQEHPFDKTKGGIELDVGNRIHFTALDIIGGTKL
jgi:hypothetical protein